eukprot:gene14692-biopygen7881
MDSRSRRGGLFGGKLNPMIYEPTTAVVDQTPAPATNIYSFPEFPVRGGGGAELGRRRFHRRDAAAAGAADRGVGGGDGRLLNHSGGLGQGGVAGTARVAVRGAVPRPAAGRSGAPLRGARRHRGGRRMARRRGRRVGRPRRAVRTSRVLRRARRAACLCVRRAPLRPPCRLCSNELGHRHVHLPRGFPLHSRFRGRDAAP